MHINKIKQKKPNSRNSIIMVFFLPSRSTNTAVNNKPKSKEQCNFSNGSINSIKGAGEGQETRRQENSEPPFSVNI